MKYKSITEALKSERPNDIIIKILSNKYALVKSAYENGKHDDDQSICGIENGKIFFYGTPYKGDFENFKKWITDTLKRMPNTTQSGIEYYDNGCGAPTWRVKIIDNRRYKQQYRKILSLI